MATWSMTETELSAAVAAHRRGLAEVLSDLPTPSWDVGSLCEGWRVREVVAHLTMPFRYSTARFVVEMVRSGGRFHRMADRCARRDAAAPTDELVSGLRDNAPYVWKPPGGSLESGLVHDVVHGLDITVPLGVSRPIPDQVLGTVLVEITKPSSLKHFGVDLDGIALSADDIDWTLGSGTPVSGRAEDLILALSGRHLPPGRLRGGPTTLGRERAG